MDKEFTPYHPSTGKIKEDTEGGGEGGRGPEVEEAVLSISSSILEERKSQGNKHKIR